MNKPGRARNLCYDLAFSGKSDDKIKSKLKAEGLISFITDAEFGYTSMMGRRAGRRQPLISYWFIRIIALVFLVWGIINVLQSHAMGGKEILWGRPIEWVAYPAIILGIGFLFRPYQTWEIVSELLIRYLRRWW